MAWKREDGYEALQLHLAYLYQPFYAMNDRAHRIGHVISVSEVSVEINSKLGLGLDNGILVGASMVHDLFNLSRDDHHKLAGEYVVKNPIEWLNEFSTQERKTMGDAAAEHRASFKGDYSSIYSEVVAAADRGSPDLKAALLRCAVYGVDVCDYREDRLYQHVIEHMQEKFGKGGYSRYSPIYLLYYKEARNEFQRAIDALTRESIDEITKGGVRKLAFAKADTV